MNIDRKILQSLIKDFESKIESNDKEFHDFKRVRAELNQCSNQFAEFLSESFEQDLKLNESIKFRWLGPEGKYWYCPIKMALFLRNYSLKIGRWSNFYSLLAVMLSFSTALFSVDISNNTLQFILCALFGIISVIMKWNIDNKIYQCSVIANHFDSLEKKT